MSTASPLPLESMQPMTAHESESALRKREVAARLQEHRARRPRTLPQDDLSAMERVTPARTSRVADSVAARFAQRESYREFLEHEAEKATHQAEAAAEIARRNAEAISQAQQQLLGEIEHWNRMGTPAGDEARVDAVLLNATAVEADAASERLPDLRIQFATEVSVVAPAETPEDSQDPVSTSASVLESLPAAEPREPALPIPGNLLEFPRQLVAARKARPRLAEGPLREEADASPARAQLRIFEVDARSIMAEPVAETISPDWATIRLEMQPPDREIAAAEGRMSSAHPIQSAALSKRFMAALVDVGCIGVAFTLAVVAAAYAVPTLPGGIPAGIAAAASLFVLFLLYELLFFTFGDATPGMRFARIGLCTFADENPSRREMRRRVLAIVLAGIPVGMGFVWACFDDEGLGWHDRISRMYQRSY